QYCSALVDDTNARASYFPGMNWTSTLPAGSADRDAIVDPLIERVFGDVASQPESSAVRNELDSLITSLCNTAACGGSRTVDVVKAVCGAAVGSAALLVKQGAEAMLIIKSRRKRALHPDEPIRHESHKRPVTRRDFLAQGFMAGGAAL